MMLKDVLDSGCYGRCPGNFSVKRWCWSWGLEDEEEGTWGREFQAEAKASIEVLWGGVGSRAWLGRSGQRKQGGQSEVPELSRSCSSRSGLWKGVRVLSDLQRSPGRVMCRRAIGSTLPFLRHPSCSGRAGQRGTRVDCLGLPCSTAWWPFQTRGLCFSLLRNALAPYLCFLPSDFSLLCFWTS